MAQDLAALAPPVIVAVAVLVGVWALVRRELAPRRRKRVQARTESPGRPSLRPSAESPAESPARAQAAEPADHEQPTS
jgi:hypothetical protein